jgi:hypothetical protein
LALHASLLKDADAPVLEGIKRLPAKTMKEVMVEMGMTVTNYR